MKKAVVRLLAIEGAALTIATLLNLVNYNSYWKKTIFRTQTVDFNILSHTLPTKLSYDLLSNDTKALQETLNSNYALFGLVVTDCKVKQKACSGQKIQYLSTSGPKPQAWKQNLTAVDLQSLPYSLLLNPLPLYPDWKYDSPHSKDNERQVSSKTNPGEVIGRVYYVRGVPPSYLADTQRWLQDPLRDSGGGRVYLLATMVCLLGGFSSWSVIEMGIFRRIAREKQLLLEAENQRTLEANKHLETQSQLTLEEKRRLEAENQRTLELSSRLEAERQLTQEKDKLLEVENKLARTGVFVGVIQDVIDQDFSSIIANRLEELKGIFRRLNTDIDNIAHDIQKAPLMRSSGGGRTLEKLRNLPLSGAEKDKTLHDIVQYIEDADQTIKFMTWIVNDLNQIANLESEPVCVQREIDKLSKNLPPNLLDKEWLTIEFDGNHEELFWINSNPWHFRSIIKNVLYNSSAALIDLYEDHDFDFQGKISVTCVQAGNEAGILVEDNGPGFPEQALKKLYQGTDKVNANAGAIRGRGSIIVFSYLTLHCGRVELANKPGGGAKALFLFPLTPAPD